MSTERDERLANRGQSADKADRQGSDRKVTEDRKATDSERLQAFRSSFFQSALPDLPKIDGYHLCWLTTTNPRDSIQARVRLGYEPVKASEVPGWEHAAVKTGEYQGLVGVNEMLAFKLPDDLYYMYMKEAHHVQPNIEEGKLNAVLETIAQEAKRKGADVEIEEGSAQLGQGPSRAIFDGKTV